MRVRAWVSLGIGERHGTLRIVSAGGGHPNDYVVYSCECDCGAQFQIPENQLILGYARYADGCEKCKRVRRSLQRRGKPSDTLTLKAHVLEGLYKEYKGGARRRNILWDLGLEDFSAITKLECHYCGVGPGRVITRCGVELLVNGLGRMDNTKGYEQGNVVPCCKACHTAKGTTPYESFLEWVRRIARFQGEVLYYGVSGITV